jgi:GNAT superfamily N-acetyltransferase
MLETENERQTMILDYALEKYPLHVKLRDGTECVVRPLGKRDAARLHKFILTVPEEERLFIKETVADRALFQVWCRDADFEHNLPLLMLHGEKIVGEACLHQRLGGWKRHIGLITVLTHPQYRGRDVAKILVAELVEIARSLGLRRLEAELNGERKVAINALEQLGFCELMRLPQHVLDMKTVPHDYVFMGADLHVDEEYAGVGE